MTRSTDKTSDHPFDVGDYLPTLGVITWCIFTDRDEIQLNGDVNSILGRRGNTPLTDLSEAISYVHEDDREFVTTQLARCSEDGAQLDFNYRIRRADSKKIHWHRLIAQPLEQPNAAPGIRGISINNDAEMRTRENLSKLNESHETAMQAVGFATWTWDAADGQFNVTPALEKLLDVPQGSLEGDLQNFVALIQGEDRDRVANVIRDSIRTGTGHELRFRRPLRNGETRWLAIRGEPQQLAESGRVQRFTGVVWDVTAETQARKEADITLGRVEAAIRIGGLAFWDVDYETQTFDYDSVGRRSGQGPAPGRLPLELLYSLISDDERIQMQHLLTRTVEERIPVEEIFHWKQERTGQTIAIHLFGDGIQNADGKVSKIAGIAVNETELIETKKQAENALARIKLATELSGISFWSYDPKNNLFEFDQHWIERSGGTDTKVTLEYLLEHVSEQNQDALRENIENAVRTGSEIRGVFDWRRPDNGEFMHILAHGHARHDETGKLSQIVGVAVDETEAYLAHAQSARYRKRHNAALKALGVGNWLLYPRENRVEIDEIFARIMGIAHSDFDGSLEAFTALVHAMDRASVDAAIAEILKTGRHPDIQFRRQLPDGTLRWLGARAEILEHKNGEPLIIAGVTWDVTESVDTRAENEKLIARVDAAAQAGGLGFWSADAHGNSITVDPNWRNLKGYANDAPQPTLEQMVGMVLPEDRNTFAQAVEEMLTTGEPLNHEYRCVHGESGEVFDVQIRGQAERSGNGEIIGFNGHVSNQTPMMTLRRETERVKGLLVDALDATRAVVFTLDPEKRAMEFIGDVRKLLGLPPGPQPETIDETFTRIHEDDLPVLYEGINRIMGGEENVEVYHRIPETHFGRTGWQRVLAHPRRDNNGTIIGVIGVTIDETEAVERRQEIDELREQYDNAMHRAGIGNWTVFLNNYTVEIDRTFAEITGLDFDTFDGRLDTLNALISQEDQLLIPDAMRAGLKTGELQEVRQQITLPNGETRWMCTRGTTVASEHGPPTRATGATWDITEIAELNQALQRSNTDLDDFAYIASHDLREPLRGIHNYSKFLAEDYQGKLDAEGDRMLSALGRLAQRLDNLLSQLLRYSQVGRTELAMEPTDLHALTREILDTISFSLEEKNVDVRLPATLPTVICDRVRVGELLRNLITNAIKYNDKPKKWIEIGHQGDACYVRDNGIGIHPDSQQRVFTIFKRLHTQGSFGGGTGSGLTIAKQIAERHGGTIWMESEPGAGSTFYFTLSGK